MRHTTIIEREYLGWMPTNFSYVCFEYRAAAVTHAALPVTKGCAERVYMEHVHYISPKTGKPSFENLVKLSRTIASRSRLFRVFGCSRVRVDGWQRCELARRAERKSFRQKNGATARRATYTNSSELNGYASSERRKNDIVLRFKTCSL